MRKGTLVIFFVALLCAALAGTLFAADEAGKTEKFDQDAALMEYWKAPDDTVVGSVNGVNVTKRQLQKMMWFWLAPRMLQDMLNQEMIKKAAADAGVQLDWAEVNKKIDESLQQGRADDIDELVAKAGATKQQFMSSIKLRTLAETAVTSQMDVPDSDYADWIKARHILIRFPQDEKDKDKKDEIAKAKIDEIAAKLKDGADFAELADEYTEDPSNESGGVKKGGDLGWFSRGRMDPNFEKAAFALEVGQVSEPVKSYFGYHLIKLEEKGESATPEEKAQLRDMIVQQKAPMEMSRWFSELRTNSDIDNKLMGPPPPPAPTMRPRPAMGPSPRPATSAPRTTPAKPETKPSEPPASPKPETPPPPSPPPAPEQ